MAIEVIRAEAFVQYDDYSDAMLGESMMKSARRLHATGANDHFAQATYDVLASSAFGNMLEMDAQINGGQFKFELTENLDAAYAGLLSVPAGRSSHHILEELLGEKGPQHIEPGATWPSLFNFYAYDSNKGGMHARTLTIVEIAQSSETSAVDLATLRRTSAGPDSTRLTVAKMIQSLDILGCDHCLRPIGIRR